MPRERRSGSARVCVGLRAADGVLCLGRVRVLVSVWEGVRMRARAHACTPLQARAARPAALAASRAVL